MKPNTLQQYMTHFLSAAATAMLLTPLSAGAVESSNPSFVNVKWATPDDWPQFINQKGEGLYASLLNAVFVDASVPVHRETLPWKRSLQYVQRGLADITGGQKFDNRYYVSRFPLIRGREIFLIQAQYKNISVRTFLNTHKGVWVNGYLSSYPDAYRILLRGVEVKTRKQALNMFLSGRADYYLDNETQMMQTLDSADYKIDSDIVTTNFFCTDIFMHFTKNERGRSIRDFYDARIEKLLEGDSLRLIYQKWNFELPPLKHESCGIGLASLDLPPAWLPLSFTAKNRDPHLRLAQ